MLSDRVICVRADFQLAESSDMSLVVNYVSEETALLVLQCDISSLEEREDLADIFDVSFACLRVDHNVV